MLCTFILYGNSYNEMDLYDFEVNHMTDEQVQQLVEELSLVYFKVPFLHQAYFNCRLKTTGGRYLLRSHNIELNKRLYDHFGEEE